MRSNVLPTIGTIGLVLVAVDCGGKSSDTTSPTPADAGPTADQACTDVAKARCAKFSSCEAIGLSLRFADEASCETREKAACTSSLAAAGTGATPSGVEACVAAFPGWACADWGNGVAPDACKPATGSLTSGASCLFSGQCQSAWCSVPKGAACGSCAPQPKAGDSCASGASCGPSMACTTDTQLCAPLITAVGGACDANDLCGFGLGCVGASGTAKGSCQAIGTALDAACDSKATKAPRCARYAGLWCSTAKCAKANLATAGQPCGLVDATTYAICTGGGDCDIPAGTPKGTCRAPSADGAACDSSAGPYCQNPARCMGTASEAGVSGACQMPSATSCK